MKDLLDKYLTDFAPIGQFLKYSISYLPDKDPGSNTQPLSAEY